MFKPGKQYLGCRYRNSENFRETGYASDPFVTALTGSLYYVKRLICTVIQKKHS